MWSILALVMALLGHASAQCSPSQLTGSIQPITQCRFGDYDFSPLSQVDLYGLANGRQYVHRVCGAVQDPLCPADSSACVFSNNPSVCDATGSAKSVLDLNATHTLVGYIGGLPSLGVSITAVSPGPFCSNGQNHTVVTNIYCSGPNIPDRLASISTIEVGCLCQTTFSLYSSLACPRSMNISAPVTAPVVASPKPALTCTLGQFGIDLRSQFAEDIQYYSAMKNERIVFNLCGAVRDTGCNRFATNGAAVAACVMTQCQNITAVGMMYNYQTPTWTYTNAVNNSNGYTMTNYMNSNNVFVIRLVCDVNATRATIVYANYPGHGIRELLVTSSLACVNESAMTLPAPQCTSGCCGMGYDFSSLKNVDITGFDNNGLGTPVAFSMCSSLRSNCNGAMACTNPICTFPNDAGTTPLSYWRGQDSADVRWTYVNGVDFTGGVRMLVNNGALCNGAPSRTEVSFICDTTAFVPRASSVWQNPTCVYQMVVSTTVVCAAPQYLGGAANIGVRNTTAKGLVVAPAKPVFGCQFAGYDFSPLASNDIYARIWPYTFFTRICGSQTHPKCSKEGNGDVSICQVDYSSCSGNPGSAWIVSLWNPYLAKWGFMEDNWENGVTMRLATGDLCGGGFPRSVIYHFVCDPSAVIPIQDQGYESPGSYICNYFIRIRTNIVCTAPTAPQIGNWSLSSSTGSSKWSYTPMRNGASTRSALTWTAVIMIVVAALL